MKVHISTMLLTAGLLGCACGPAAAAVHIEGQVQAGGGPLASSTVTLWAASAGDPRQLAQTTTGSDGQFELLSQETPGADVSLYLVAKGGVATVSKGSGNNPATTAREGASLPQSLIPSRSGDSTTGTQQQGRVQTDGQTPAPR